MCLQGISQVSADLPVAEKVESYQFFALFLGLLLNLIAIILLALCSMLIGSLLLVSVETRCAFDRDFDVCVCVCAWCAK